MSGATRSLRTESSLGRGPDAQNPRTQGVPRYRQWYRRCGLAGVVVTLRAVFGSGSDRREYGIERWFEGERINGNTWPPRPPLPLYPPGSLPKRSKRCILNWRPSFQPRSHPPPTAPTRRTARFNTSGCRIRPTNHHWKSHDTDSADLKLLRTCHLNVPERRQLTPPAIHFTEILAVITDYLHLNEPFLIRVNGPGEGGRRNIPTSL